MSDLILGASGLVGLALSNKLPGAIQGVQMEATAINQIYTDITKHETLYKAFSLVRPKIVYLAAAITDVNKCEDWGTNVVNVRGSTNVIRLCEQFESQLVFFSSSYVFDGLKIEPYLENDDPNPLQHYGKQKLTVENLILQSLPDSFIIRTVGVFGKERKRKNFAKQVVASVFASKQIFAPVDQFMNPINSDDLADLTIRAVRNYKGGIFHIAGDSCVSKYEYAKRIAGYFGYEDKVIGMTTEEMGQRALRPRMGCLASSDFELPSLDRGIQSLLQSKDFYE